jgi:hypothetical protein
MICSVACATSFGAFSIASAREHGSFKMLK